MSVEEGQDISDPAPSAPWRFRFAVTRLHKTFEWINHNIGSCLFYSTIIVCQNSRKHSETYSFFSVFIQKLKLKKLLSKVSWRFLATIWARYWYEIAKFKWKMKALYETFDVIRQLDLENLKLLRLDWYFLQTQHIVTPKKQHNLWTRQARSRLKHPAVFKLHVSNFKIQTWMVVWLFQLWQSQHVHWINTTIR